MSANAKLSVTQRDVLAFMAAGHAPFLAHYAGPPGAECARNAGFFWRQYDRTKTPPRVPATSVCGLIKRGLLVYDGDGDYKLSEAGLALISD